jgi:hypothetical protein
VAGTGCVDAGAAELDGAATGPVLMALVAAIVPEWAFAT